jgi:polysaccharide chain length determinant protein (PEP-CTERM system associated)
MNSETKYIVHNRNEKELKEYLMMLWYKKWLITAVLILALVSSYFITAQMQRIYQTSTLVMVQTESGPENLFSDQISFIGENDKLLNTYSRIITSRRILDDVIKDIDLRNEEGELISTGALKQNISVQSGGDTDLLTVQVNYHDPELARDIANSIVENMQQTTQELNRASLQGASEFIDEQLEETQARLLNLEDDLLNYREDKDIVMPETQGENLLNRYTELEANYTEADLSSREAQLSLDEINSELAEVDKAETINRSPEISELQSDLTSLYTELEGLLTKYTEKHPAVLEVQAKIDNLETRLERKTTEIVNSRTEAYDPLYQDLNSQIISLQVQQVTADARKAVYQNRIEEIEDDLSAFPQEELEYSRLLREKNVAEEIYLLLRNRKEEINIQQAMQTSDIFVVEDAHLPNSPIKPNLILNLAVAALLALMLSVGIIFLLDYLDNTIKNEDQLEEISELPVLGIIPDLHEIDHHKNYGEGAKNAEKE